MKIKDGSITENAAIAANYYRFIDGGYTIIKGNLPSATIATSEDEAKQGAKIQHFGVTQYFCQCSEYSGNIYN